MKQHILVVDDEPEIRELLSFYLRNEGYEVSTASTSDETHSCLAANHVNIIVLDVYLAEEDGLTLLRYLKGSHPEVQIIMLTGRGFSLDLMQQAHDNGADGYLSKVLPLHELLMTIERAVERPGPAVYDAGRPPLVSQIAPCLIRNRLISA